MSRFLSISILFALLLLAGGCIHTYPDPRKEEDPTLVETVFVLGFPGDWEKVEAPRHRASGDGRKRVVLELRGAGSAVMRKEFTAEMDDGDGRTLTIPAPFLLEPREYRLAVWCDDSQFSAYDVADFNDIPAPGKHFYSHDPSPCYCYSGSFDLSEAAGEWSRSVEVPVAMECPTGRFRIVADDYASFLATFRDGISKGESYSVEISYGSPVAAAFNLNENSPARPVDNVVGSRTLDIITIPGIEMEIASGRLFVPEEGMEITLTLTLYNSAKAVVSRTAGVTLPVHRGKVTTVRGDFLTDFIIGGISVDTAWDGEIIVDI